jgi:hypothetical protein
VKTFSFNDNFEFTISWGVEKDQKFTFDDNTNFSNALYLVLNTYKGTGCNNNVFFYSSKSTKDNSIGEESKDKSKEFLFSTRKQNYIYLSTGIELDKDFFHSEYLFDRFVKLKFDKIFSTYFFFNLESRECAEALRNYIDTQIKNEDLSHNIIIRLNNKDTISKYQFDWRNMLMLEYYTNEDFKSTQLVNLRKKDKTTLSVAYFDKGQLFNMELGIITEFKFKILFEKLLLKTCLIYVTEETFNYCIINNLSHDKFFLIQYIKKDTDYTEEKVDLLDFFRFDVKVISPFLQDFDTYIYQLKDENDSLIHTIELQIDITEMLAESICRTNQREFYFNMVSYKPKIGKVILDEEKYGVIVDYFDENKLEYKKEDIIILKNFKTGRIEIKLADSKSGHSYNIFENNYYSDDCYKIFEQAVKKISLCQEGYRYTYIENSNILTYYDQYEPPQTDIHSGKVKVSIINEIKDDKYIIRKFVKDPDSNKYQVELMSPENGNANELSVTKIWFDHQNSLSGCTNFKAFVENQPYPVGENNLIFYSTDKTELQPPNGLLEFSTDGQTVKIGETLYEYKNLMLELQVYGIYSKLKMSLEEIRENTNIEVINTIEVKKPGKKTKLKKKNKEKSYLRESPLEIQTKDERFIDVTFNIYFSPLTNKALWMSIMFSYFGEKSCSNGFVAFKEKGKPNNFANGLLYINSQGLIKMVVNNQISDYAFSKLSYVKKSDSYYLNMFDLNKNKIKLHFDIMYLFEPFDENHDKAYDAKREQKIMDKYKKTCFNGLKEFIVDSKICSPTKFAYQCKENKTGTGTCMLSFKRINGKPTMIIDGVKQEAKSITINKLTHQITVNWKGDKIEIFNLRLRGNYTCEKYFKDYFTAFG